MLTARLETLATAEYPGAAHELVAVCKALAAIDAATADLVRGLPGPDEPSAEVAARKARVQRDDSRFIARVRAADPAELNDALREAVRRLRHAPDAIETDARTDTEACDLADEAGGSTFVCILAGAAGHPARSGPGWRRGAGSCRGGRGARMGSGAGA